MLRASVAGDGQRWNRELPRQRDTDQGVCLRPDHAGGSQLPDVRARQPGRRASSCYLQRRCHLRTFDVSPGRRAVHRAQRSSGTPQRPPPPRPGPDAAWITRRTPLPLRVSSAQREPPPGNSVPLVPAAGTAYLGSFVDPSGSSASHAKQPDRWHRPACRSELTALPALQHTLGRLRSRSFP